MNLSKNKIKSPYIYEYNLKIYMCLLNLGTLILILITLILILIIWGYVMHELLFFVNSSMLSFI